MRLEAGTVIARRTGQPSSSESRGVEGQGQRQVEQAGELGIVEHRQNGGEDVAVTYRSHSIATNSILCMFLQYLPNSASSYQNEILR